MKRKYWKLLSLICLIIMVICITLQVIYTSNRFLFLVSCIMAIITGFTMDSWWKKVNSSLGY